MFKKFFLNCAIYGIVCERCSDSQATDDNMMYAQCMLDA